MVAGNITLLQMENIGGMTYLKPSVTHSRMQG